MKLIIACLVVLSLPAAACPPAAQAAFGVGYGDPCAAPVSSFGAGGYGMPVAVAQAPAYGVNMNFAAAPVRHYGMVRSFGAAAPLYGGSFSAGAFGGPVVQVVHTRPGLFGRIHAARQAFRRGF